MTEKNDDLIIPQHLGFILDGNRRWAKERGLPTLEGHRRGFNRLTKLADNCLELGVKHVSTFCFSTENWDRDPKEVDYLMDLFREMLDKTIKKFHEKDVRFILAGRLEDFAPDIQEKAKKAMELTKNNKSLTFNAALSYGGRAEIVDATKKIIEAGLKPEEITEEKFSEYIYEAGQPDLDMVVRTSGEQRLSGFMLWQSSYAEFYFIKDKHWPDFDKKALEGVIQEYSRRERRFGK